MSADSIIFYLQINFNFVSSGNVFFIWLIVLHKWKVRDVRMIDIKVGQPVLKGMCIKCYSEAMEGGDLAKGCILQ